MPDDPTEPSSEQRPGIDSRTVDRDRTLDAVHRLEAALGGPAPGRRDAWRRDVLAALDRLDDASREEERNAERPESLLSDIARNEPMLRHRVHVLRSQYRHVRNTIATIRQELAQLESDFDVPDIRERLAWVLTALRYQRARESDLIFEALAIDEEGREG